MQVRPMNKIFTLLMIGFGSFPASAADYFDKKYEVQMSPNLGWSSFSGYLLGVDAALLNPLSERWQWKTAGGFTARTKNDYVNFALELGPVYNFGFDWAEAFFIGAGIGYGNQNYLGPRDDNDNRQIYGYLEGGKRLPLNRSKTFMWVPNAKIRANSFHFAEVSISPLNFSYTF